MLTLKLLFRLQCLSCFRILQGRALRFYLAEAVSRKDGIETFCFHQAFICEGFARIDFCRFRTSALMVLLYWRCFFKSGYSAITGRRACTRRSLDLPLPLTANTAVLRAPSIYLPSAFSYAFLRFHPWERGPMISALSV